MTTLGELHIGHLKSKRIAELYTELEEMRSVSLDFPADPFLDAWKRSTNNGSIYRGDSLVILPISSVVQVLTYMGTTFGAPVSYEVKKNFGKKALKSKNYERFEATPARLIQWKLKTLSQSVVVAKELQQRIGDRFYITGGHSLTIYAPPDCFVQVLMKLPESKWADENARKYAQLQKRRKIQTVVDRLDRKK